jgi:hypothetical protein
LPGSGESEPEFVDFLLDYRASTEYRDLEDGDALAQRFDTEPGTASER